MGRGGGTFQVFIWTLWEVGSIPGHLTSLDLILELLTENGAVFKTVQNTFNIK